MSNNSAPVVQSMELGGEESMELGGEEESNHPILKVSEYERFRENNIRRNAQWNIEYDADLRRKQQDEALIQDSQFQAPQSLKPITIKKRRCIDGADLNNMILEEEEAKRYACTFCNNFVPPIGAYSYIRSRSAHYSHCVEYQKSMPKRETRSDTTKQKEQQKSSSSSSSLTSTANKFGRPYNEDVEFVDVPDDDNNANYDSGNDSVNDDILPDDFDDHLEEEEHGDNSMRTDYNGPSFKVLNHQNRIIKLLDKEKLIHVRKHRADHPESLSAFDYNKLAQLGECFNNRDSDGDFCFKIINEILIAHGLDHLIKFPKQFRSVRKFVSDLAKKMTTVNIVEIPIDEQIWGIKDKFNNIIPAPWGVAYDIPQQIGMQFLECNPENVRSVPTNSTNDRNEPIIKDFFDAKVCHELHKFMIEQNGYTYTCPRTNKEYRNMLVYILESEDGVQLDLSKKVESEPLVCKVANLINEDSKYFCIGMSPTDPLRMTDASADEHLLYRGMQIKGRREQEIKQRKREVHGIWYKSVHNSLTKIEQKGFFLKIGRSVNAEIVVAIPVLVCTPGFGDNKGCDKLLGICSSKNGRKCRICNHLDMNDFGTVSTTRNHIFHQRISLDLYNLNRKLWFDNLKVKKSKGISPEEQQIIDKANKYNIIASGPNSDYIYHAGQRLIDLSGGALEGTFIMAPADQLHTFWKGPMEAALVMLLQCIYYLKVINFDKYSFIGEKLNMRVKEFNRKQSVLPFYIENMSNGITNLFTENRNNSNKTKFASCLPASRSPGLVWISIMAIGDNGDILPNTNIIPKMRTNQKHLKALIQILGKWNVQTVILNALNSCLNVQTLSDRGEDGFTNNHLEILDKSICLLRAHMAILNELRDTLKHAALWTNKTFTNTLDVLKIVHTPSKGYKLHNYSHTAVSVTRFGPLSFWDTIKSEHYHIIMKGLYQICSKNTFSKETEMIRKLNIKYYLDMFGREIERREEKASKLFDETIITTQTAQPAITNNDNSPIQYTFKSSFHALSANITFNSRTDLFEVTKDDYHHPFLKMENFGKHAFGTQSKITGKWIGGLQSTRRAYLNDLIQNDSDVNMSFISSIECNGALSLGISKFKIQCSRISKRNRHQLENANQVLDYVFNFVIINYKNQGRIIVRVLAIVQQKKRVLQKGVNGINKIIIDTIYSLIVLRLRPLTEDNNDTYQYSGEIKKGLDIDIVPVEVVVGPACVIQKYTNLCPPNYKECYHDIYKNKGAIYKWKFIHVNISKHLEFDLFEYNSNKQRNTTDENLKTSCAQNLYLSDEQMDLINKHQKKLFGSTAAGVVNNQITNNDDDYNDDDDIDFENLTDQIVDENE